MGISTVCSVVVVYTIPLPIAYIDIGYGPGTSKPLFVLLPSPPLPYVQSRVPVC